MRLNLNSEALLGLALLLIYFCRQALSLECYVCHDQDGNHGKCLKTIQTCEPEHDRCMSTIRWSIQPYWSQGAEKQYYVSKRCSNETECYQEIHGNMAICHYIWYEDWKCAECCQGDRCNYYVTLGAANAQPSRILQLAVVVVLGSLGIFRLL